MRPDLFSLPRAPGAAVLTLLLAACGGGSDPAPATSAPGPSPEASSGTLLVGLTDADGDFLSYVVGVAQLSLERADGTLVETLPQATPVDFAQYTELTEFVTAASVPTGTYVAAQITLDYADSEVLVEKDGDAVAAEVRNADGEPLDVATFRIRLAERNQLTIRPGVPSVMVVDFDLAASHEVDLSTSPVAVTAEPFLLAEIDPVETKRMRVRGPLISVDTGNAQYVTALRPFWLWGGDFGRLVVHTGGQTAFEVDGIAYTGADGLAAMAALEPGAATLAFGTLDVAERRFDAKEVYAGSSVPGHRADIARGVVIARDGDVVTLRGALLVRERGDLRRHREIDVQLGPDTLVRKAGMPDFDGGIEAVSVGQRLTAFGRLDIEDRLLDASHGGVRLLPTIATGIAIDVTPSLLALSLQRLGGVAASRLDFTGTGMPGMDADAANYEIGTGALDLSGVVPGAPVKAAGFVTAFGFAPPDFEATTVADFGDVRADLGINWRPPSDAAFLAVGPEGLILNLDDPAIGRRHHVYLGGIRVDLLDVGAATVLPESGRPGLYAIRERGDSRLYTDFGRFTDDLATALAGGSRAAALQARGQWSDADSELAAHRIVVLLR